MTLSTKAQAALDKVVAKFETGDLSSITALALIRRHPDDWMPSSKWTFSNQVLAYIQTGTLDCRGYRQWQDVGRQVKKGASAAFILGPLMYKKADEKTGEERQVLCGFRGIAVFPVDATEGDPLPEFDYSPSQLPPLADVAQRMGIEVEYRPLPPDRVGDHLNQRIRLGSHDNEVFFHELAHALHDRVGDNGAGPNKRETVAEFTACVLASLYGEDVSGNAWRYIQAYSSDPIRAIAEALGDVEKILSVLFGEAEDEN